jgi:hypothetical protein
MEWWDDINIEESAAVVIAAASFIAAIFWLWGSLIRLPPFPDTEVSAKLIVERAYRVLRTANRLNATGALFAGIAALALFILLVSPFVAQYASALLAPTGLTAPADHVEKGPGWRQRFGL